MDSKFWSTESALSPDTLGALMEARQTVRPRRLAGPVPRPDELRHWLGSAASAPDHGRNRPWRLVLVPASLRPALGTAFTPADVLQVSWLALCTQGADVVRINWWRFDVARCQLSFQQVAHEH